MPGSRLPDLPAASPTPETLPHTALAPPPSVPAPRPAPPPVQSSQSSQSASTRPQHPPPFFPSSDNKRPGFLVKAPPHKPALDTCPSLPTPDRWAMLFLLQSAPAVVPTTKAKAQIKVPSRNPPPIGHL